MTAKFTTATTLVAGLVRAQAERRLEERLLALSKPKLLIVDELGYLPLEPQAAHLFFQLVSRRYEKGAMLITSNRSVGEWGTVFGPSPRTRPTATGPRSDRRRPRAGVLSPFRFAPLRENAGHTSNRGQFFVSPGGQFRLSLDTVRREAALVEQPGKEDR